MFADVRWVGFHPPQKILYEKCKGQKFQVKLPENETLIKIGIFWNVNLAGKFVGKIWRNVLLKLRMVWQYFSFSYVYIGEVCIRKRQ